MEIELFNVEVMYPNENENQTRKLKIRTEEDNLFIDFIDPKINSSSLILGKDQVEILVDTLKLILKNKLIE